MNATPEQIAAAEAALKRLAESKIAALPSFAQFQARQALSDALLGEFATVAVNAALAAK